MRARSAKLSRNSAAIIADYRGGVSIYALAAKFGGTYDGVRRLLRRHSLAIVPVVKDTSQAEAVALAFTAGLTIKSIANKFEINRWKVRYILRRRGLIEAAPESPGGPERHHNAKRQETRNCLCCGKPFKSFGIGNRLCAQHQSDGGAFA